MIWTSIKRVAVAALYLIGFAAQAAPVTYTYTGPNFVSRSEHLVVSFTTSAPLAANRSYLSQADAGVTTSAVQVFGSGGQVANFNLPVTTLQVHTNGAGAIDSWFIFGDFNSLTGLAPTMTGVDRQAYTMNTMAYIPGTGVPGAVGLVTGHYMYDQATETQFYPSCSGAPSGCTLAGNGQPYVSVFGGIINPSNTSGASWVVSGVTPPPPPPPPPTVSITGNLTDGIVGVGYVATLNAGGGTAPYTWSASNLPPGLTMRDGVVSGTPTIAGQYAVGVTATDLGGAMGSSPYSINIVYPTCSGSNAVITSVGRDFLVVNGGLALGDHVWYTPKPAGTTFTGGTTTFDTGELIDFAGWMDPVSGCHANAMTVKPAPSQSCVPPLGAKHSTGQGVVTAVGPNYLVANRVRIDYAACTILRLRERKTAPAVGDKVEWKGFVQPNGNTMATRLSFN